MPVNSQIKVAVVGANGYTGSELLRLLATHPHVSVSLATSRSEAGKPLAEVFTHLTGLGSLPFEFTDASPAQVAAACDLAFTCLPHGESQAWVADLLRAGTLVIDLSADFRYNDIRVYEKAYAPHSKPDLAASAVYGLVECNRDAIRQARLIANPGCYPTSVLLALVPLAKIKLLSPDCTIIVDSQSGVSGAGRTAKQAMLHGEISENLQAYGLPQHRHESEMQYQTQMLGGVRADIIFTPHLAPANRGIISTIHLPLDAADIRDALLTAYAQTPFVHVLPEGQLPKSAAVRGSNHAHLQVVKRRKNHATVLSVIDNLGKGAAGQAIQNLNVRMGWDETAGLKLVGLMP